jgi:hypothetical protein
MFVRLGSGLYRIEVCELCRSNLGTVYQMLGFFLLSLSFSFDRALSLYLHDYLVVMLHRWESHSIERI